MTGSQKVETTLNGILEALYDHCHKAREDDDVKERGIDITIDGKTFTVYPLYDPSDDPDDDDYKSDYRFFMNSSRNGVFMIIK